MRLTWLGHSSVLIEGGGTRVLTDPVLRDRVMHLRRVAAPVGTGHRERIDAILLSHLHHDHLDLPSLHSLGTAVQLVVPAGSATLMRKHGFERVVELRAEETTELADGVRVVAVHAHHASGRLPFGTRADPLGYVVEADGARVYFAGDTDLFPGMAELGRLDVALIPVWGWGPQLGPGHLDPARAAEAAALLQPRVAVPIHWGTFFPIGRRDRASRLTDPPHEFARAVERRSPAVEVRVLAPGESFDARA